jgi:phosphoribosylaminoimidazole-succinocarboxamide synthase
MELPGNHARETMKKAVRETNFPDVPLFARGKVRDVYNLGNNLLIVATDRVSAFDVVMPTPIPGRGVILTQMSLFWFKLMDDIVSNHVVPLTSVNIRIDCRNTPMTSKVDR